MSHLTRHWRLIPLVTCISTLILALFACFFLQSGQGIAATNAVAQQVVINAQIGFGLQNLANTTILNYQEPNTTTAKFQNSVTIFVPAATADNTINLATLFPGINTAVVYSVADISEDGQEVDIGMASGGTRFTMAAGGFMAIRVNGSAPTLYVDNDSSDTPAILQVSVLAN